MTVEIVLVLSILSVSVLFLITEWIPMEVTALLALGVVSVTRLVSPVEALSGFSNPAVVTVWAVFILSGGLTRTGVAKIIGNFILRLAGKREITMIVVIMTTSGVMSAVMNNVAVAALMLPVVMDIARHTDTSPSRLLMPLAYGSLLGGLTTQIGTPPNILVTEALRDNGLTPFAFFDFTPVGLIVMFSGIAFMALIGKHLLPKRDMTKETSTGRKASWQTQYDLEERLFYVHIPSDSILVNRTLSQTRIGSILGWSVIGITREKRTFLAPGPDTTLQAGDRLTMEGRIEAIDELKNWRRLVVEEQGIDVSEPYSNAVKIAEVRLSGHSRLVGNTPNRLGFRTRFEVNVLAIRRQDHIRRTNLSDETFLRGDTLLIAGPTEHLEALGTSSGVEEFRYISRTDLIDVYRFPERLMSLRVSPESGLAGKSLKESRLSAVLGSQVLGILRGNDPLILPEPSEILQSGDRLLVQWSPADLELLEELERIEIAKTDEFQIVS